MEKIAFISRHAPTQEQESMANAQGFTIVHIGDADAFSVTSAFVYDKGPFEYVCVVHPAAALRLAGDFVVSVFENGQRSEDGGKLTFYPKAMHFYDIRS